MFYLAVVCYVGERFAADGDSLLRDPGAMFAGEGFFQDGIPGRFAGFPAQGDTGAAIFVGGLEDQIAALGADEGEEFDGFAVVASLYVGDDAGPRDVVADDGTFIDGEERGVPLIGQHGEERFYVRNFAAQGVGDTDGVGCVGLDQSVTFGGPGNDVVNKDAAVDEIDFFAVSAQGFPVKDEVARIGN